MTPQLTLQTPLQLPPNEIPSYLNQLWSKDETSGTGANTFCLIIWQPAWIEQQLVNLGKIKGPITGTKRAEVVNGARQIVLDNNLPLSTFPFDLIVKNKLSDQQGSQNSEDLRGQNIDAAISALQPRRLITLAPTIEQKNPLETLVAAYCPLPEEGGGSSACGDVVVLRGGINAISSGLKILENLLPEEMPSWLWWNGSLDEAPELLKSLATSNKRLVIDSALGQPMKCLDLLERKISSQQAVNDLNWLRLRNWRETLAMVFDPPERHESLQKVVKLDIDIQGDHPVQGLLLVAWIADRLNWNLKKCSLLDNKVIEAEFQRLDKEIISFHLIPLPVGNPSVNPGQVIGIRMICDPKKDPKDSLCVILGAESGECMRLEAGGMSNMDLLEELVPTSKTSVEMDVARLLSSSRGSTSPLFSNAVPIAKKLLKMASQQNH